MQLKFKQKLKSGKTVTGFMDIMGGVKENGVVRQNGTIIMEFWKDLLEISDKVQTREDFDKLVLEVQKDPKHKYVIAIYGVIIK